MQIQFQFIFIQFQFILHVLHYTYVCFVLFRCFTLEIAQRSSTGHFGRFSGDHVPSGTCIAPSTWAIGLRRFHGDVAGNP